MNKKQKKMLTRIIIAAVMLIALRFIPVTFCPLLYTTRRRPVNHCSQPAFLFTKFSFFRRADVAFAWKHGAVNLRNCAK